jgi:hypothetical protein
MKITKYIILLIASATTYWLFTLPSASDIENKVSPSGESFAELSDYDFRSQADIYWQEGLQSHALNLLQTAIDLKTNDETALKEKYNQYLKEISDRNSTGGHLKAMGYAFITGEVNSFDELAGASVADFFIYGDIRDVSKELIFKESADPFILTLSSIGLLTTVFPPADPLVSILKSAQKSKSLPKALIGQLSQILKPLSKNLKNVSATELKNIIKSLLPIYELSQKSKTWHQFSTLLKQCDKLKQVKFINKVIQKNQNGAKLTSLLTSLNKFPESSKATLSFIKNHGQQGMDKLYTALRKGPRGIQFLLKNPTLFSRLAKNTIKSQNLLQQYFTQKWTGLVMKHGRVMEIARYLAIILCLLLIFKTFKKKSQSHESLPTNSSRTKLINLTLILVGGICLLTLLQKNSSQHDLSPTIDVQTKISLGADSLSPSSLILLLLFAAAQIWAFVKIKKEVQEINDLNSAEEKLNMLHHIDFYFDLPIYLGLAGTVTSFIMLTIDPSGSRIIAYATTISGILLSLYMRAQVLLPIKKRLLRLNE